MEEEKLENAPKFLRWKKALEENKLQIHGIQEHFTRRRYNGEVLFSLLTLDATTPEGDKIPPVCFLKGEVVCVLVCLIDEETQEKYVILVKQRRIAEGGYTYEHPAGMVDGSVSPIANAVQEVREETGVQITEEELIVLGGGKRFFPSTGTSDEAMYFFACEITLPFAKIMGYDQQNRGTDYEHERIITVVKPFEEAHALITNTNGLLLNFLYLQQVKDRALWEKLG